MQRDPTKETSFKNEAKWHEISNNMAIFSPDPNDQTIGKVVGNSLSGGERNRLFFQSKDNFSQATLVSGLDFQQDGRGFGILDFDQDGFVDLAVVTTQSPRFRLMKNQLAERAISSEDGTPNQSLSVLLVGGQKNAEPTEQWSSRDAIGALVIVTCGDIKRIFQRSCGEGLSSQNSQWIHVGLGHRKIDQIEVIWPSGKVSKRTEFEPGKRLTIFENPADDG